MGANYSIEGNWGMKFEIGDSPQDFNGFCQNMTVVMGDYLDNHPHLKV